MIILQVPGARTTNITKRVPWGVCLHTTGRGITSQAKKTGKKPIEVALKTYLASQAGSNGYPWGGPGYCIEHDGTIHKLAEDTTRTQHVGGLHRADYLSGKWLNMCAPVAIAEWHRRWPQFKSPQDLFPSTAPNTDYVGIEMIPCGDGLGKPMRKGLLFTKEQHEAAAELCADIAERIGFDKVNSKVGWWLTPRLVGHEDVGLIDRHDKGGGWDPGFLRPAPYIDFEYIREMIGDIT